MESRPRLRGSGSSGSTPARDPEDDLQAEGQVLVYRFRSPVPPWKLRFPSISSCQHCFICLFAANIFSGSPPSPALPADREGYGFKTTAQKWVTGRSGQIGPDVAGVEGDKDWTCGLLSGTQTHHGGGVSHPPFDCEFAME